LIFTIFNGTFFAGNATPPVVIFLLGSLFFDNQWGFVLRVAGQFLIKVVLRK
jgi:hypothetical protein